MESYQETRQQLRTAILIIAIIIPIGVIGFMVLEGQSLLNAIWLAVITLSTIGYGDITAKTDAGRIFTMLFIVTGLGAFAFAIQASLAMIFSPENIDVRQRRQAARHINQLQHHYIITGEGELVDRTVRYLIRRKETQRAKRQQMLTSRLDEILDRLFRQRTFRPIRKLLHQAYLMFYRDSMILDTVVVVTQDKQFAKQLRQNGVLVVEGESSDDQILRQAGLKQAQGLMALSHSDTETLLTILTAHSRKEDLFITAALEADEFVSKVLRVGANSIIKPYEVAGQFLNNATFRPAVNDFFNTLLFDTQGTGAQVVQLFLLDNSPWIGKRLWDLRLRERFNTTIIGIRCEDGSFVYAPDDDYILREEEILLAVTSAQYTEELSQNCHGDRTVRPMSANWQRLPAKPIQLQGSCCYTSGEAEAQIAQMSEHYIICAGSPIASSAIEKLNPDRPFVIISSNETQTEALLQQGFRVVHGNPADEKVLHKAGITRALAMMISLDDRVQNVLTTLTSRTLSRRLLITATADSDDMVAKLRRAGADRVISPFRIAAQSVLLATFRPVMSDFLHYVLFNYAVRLETTELYMQDDSPWIGKSLDELLLKRIFSAGVLGIRQANGRYIYNPPETHIIKQHEILIVTVPMNKSDLLREGAHGSLTKRPKSLRHEDLLKTTIWT